MLDYQKQYIANVEKIIELSDIRADLHKDFETWYNIISSNNDRIAILRNNNISLLNDNLFVTLDNLYNASDEDINNLEEFADVLLDYNNNYDPGVYIVIHEALLNLYRQRKQRTNIIKELYKLGMGYYYQNRITQGIGLEHSRRFWFEDEMLFTEGGSYFEYFEEIEDEETRGYILRSLANIAISSKDYRHKVATSSRMINILKDDYYHTLAPNLPWDTFLRKTYQQMSANREAFSTGDLNQLELSEVLEACQIVFEPEKEKENPNIQWLWPYYEMEYSLGFADAATTLQRMEELITSVEYDDFDNSGIYGNIVLPVYYGHLLSKQTIVTKRNIDFLNYAYQKMMKTVISYPDSTSNDFFEFALSTLTSNYYEMHGVQSYYEIMKILIIHFMPASYIEQLRLADILVEYAKTILENDIHFFDDADFINKIQDEKKKKEEIYAYLKDCAHFYNSGLIHMNMERLSLTRNRFEREQELFKLHTLSGYDDLSSRESTKRFADIALGHHKYFDGTDGYPDEYIRNSSQYRIFVDLVAVCVYINNQYEDNFKDTVEYILSEEHKRFSPLITSYLLDESLSVKIKAILQKDDKVYYRQYYDDLKGTK